ncbi:MAG: class I SAM-dependent methyltransferase [Acidimicrobiia bacterium]|nr:class I SAM-dependent methyltransferase [Acidimicrobiia bacterium]
MYELKCRGCGAALSEIMVDLGPQPLANSYVPVEAARAGELFIPLTVYVCSQCYMVQLHHEVPPSAIFSDYAYQSSWSTSYVEHARRYVDMATARLGLDSSSRVVEIASNDGYLLQWFVAKGIPVLGIEPAANIAVLAEAKGIPSRVQFFETSVGRQVRDEVGPADLMIANNVLAHVHELHDFVGGFRELLAPTGRVTFEFPHLLRLMEQVEFDTIYHEHFSYFSLLALEPVFAAEGLAVVDVEELSVHGGALRLWLAHTGATPETPNVDRIRQAEAAAGLDRLHTYTQFGRTVAQHKREMLVHLIGHLDAGKRLAAYGAPAKGNTLLNYCGIGVDMIPFTVDRNPDKQGTLLPGTRIPVRAPEVLPEEKPDVVVILPWNLADEIAPMVNAASWGGVTEILRPHPRVVG